MTALFRRLFRRRRSTAGWRAVCVHIINTTR